MGSARAEIVGGGEEEGGGGGRFSVGGVGGFRSASSGRERRPRRGPASWSLIHRSSSARVAPTPDRSAFTASPARGALRERSRRRARRAPRGEGYRRRGDEGGGRRRATTGLVVAVVVVAARAGGGGDRPPRARASLRAERENRDATHRARRTVPAPRHEDIGKRAVPSSPRSPRRHARACRYRRTRYHVACVTRYVSRLRLRRCSSRPSSRPLRPEPHHHLAELAVRKVIEQRRASHVVRLRQPPS